MPRGPNFHLILFHLPKQLFRVLPRMYKCRLESLTGWFLNPPIPAPTYSKSNRLIDRSDDHFPQPPNVKDLMADTMDLFFRPSFFFFVSRAKRPRCLRPSHLFLSCADHTKSPCTSILPLIFICFCNQICVLCTTFTLLTFYLSNSILLLLLLLFLFYSFFSSPFLLSSLYSITPSCRSALGRRRSHYQAWLPHQVGSETSSLPHQLPCSLP